MPGLGQAKGAGMDFLEVCRLISTVQENREPSSNCTQLLVPPHFSVLGWLAFSSVGSKLDAVPSEQNYIKTSNLLEFLISAV